MSFLSRANAILIVAVPCAAIAIVGCRRPQIVSRVDSQSIRSIKIGMTEREVTAILGQPLQIRPWGDGAAIYDYAIPGWAVSSPSLWISFEKGKVRTVHAKLHRVVGDDQAVYELRADQPKFESPDFESTFKRAR
jgi:hypothetical protein